MTKEFLGKINLPEGCEIPAEVYEQLDLVESCIAALNEGIFDARVITTTLSASKISYMEILDRAKEALIRLLSRVMSDLNNMFINNVRLFARYKEVIVAGLQRMDHSIVHETFEYPDSRNFPTVIGSGVNEREILRLQDSIADGSFTSGDAAYRVDSLIQDFSRKVLGETVDLYDIKTSVKRITELKVRGRRTTLSINAHTVEQYLKTLQDYRGEKEALTQIQRNVKEDYERLKDSYKKISNDPMKAAEARRRDLRYLQDPDMANFNAAESGRFADIHVQVMRLFNSYIDIYNTAYATKLQLLEEKYFDSRNLMVEIFRETNAFASMNRAAPGGTTVIQYNPRLNGMK